MNSPDEMFDAIVSQSASVVATIARSFVDQVRTNRNLTDGERRAVAEEFCRRLNAAVRRRDGVVSSAVH